MKKVLVVLATLTFAFVLSGCEKSGAEETVKFGVIGPLSGDYSEYGIAVKQGAELAAKELNANGGVLDMDLEIISYDSEGASDKGVTAYTRLRDLDGIDALIGGTFSGVTSAIKVLAVDDAMPVLTPTATNPLITLDADNVFRACFTDAFQGQAAAKFAVEDLSAGTAAILYNQSDTYSTGLADAFEAEFAKTGTVVKRVSFSTGDASFTAQLTAIMAESPDIVFLPGYVAEVGAVLTQASDLGMEVPFLGGDGWDSIEGQYQAVAEGNYFTNHYAKSDESETVQSFITAFEAEYGSSPNALAALAYDAVYAMAAAFEAAGSVDNAEVVAALETLNYEDAVTGAITFDENGDPIKPVTIIQLDSTEASGHKYVTTVTVD